MGRAPPRGTLVALLHDRRRSRLARGHPARLAPRTILRPFRRREAARGPQAPPPSRERSLQPALVQNLYMSHAANPFALKDAPALIERLLPVQKLSAEAYKERMAGAAQALTALGNFWKGRKPLILNKACILACLLPATGNPKRDLEIFERLMATHQRSRRNPRRSKGPRLPPRQGRRHRGGGRNQDLLPRFHQRNQKRLRPELRNPLGRPLRRGSGLGGG